MTGVHALNALGDGEREAFERHAAASPESAQEARELAETAALLALGTPEVTPPPRLKKSVMDAIRSTRQLPAVAAPADADDGVDTDADAGSSDPETAPAVESPRPPSSVPPAASPGSEAPTGPAVPAATKWWALAAGLLLLATGGLAGVVAVQQNEQSRLQEQLTAAQSSQAALHQLFASSDLKTAVQRLDDGATVSLSYSAAEGMMAVSTRGLPEPPSGHGYELWLISGDGATPAGMLSAEAVSAAELTMVTGPMEGVTHFGITVEPEGGSPAPTTDPIVLQEL
ncbi:anti-sigma factor domain-containing protein [Zafaria sp. Z1313]|uniref:anti-sigma factor n=1 Tax=Zafaria sp. Z1313 TaxID=3423202 RepID=UPI003D302544